MLNRHARALSLLDDMRVAGFVGVMTAARRFDLSKLVSGRPMKFFPYCKLFVEGRIWFVALEEFSAFSVPANFLKTAVRIRTELAAMGAEATDGEVSEASGIPKDKVALLWSASNCAMSLSSLEDDESAAFLSGDQETVEENPKLKPLLERLTQFEKDAVESVYGRMEPVEAMARRYGTTDENVKRTAETALARMNLEAFGQLDLSLGSVETVLYESADVAQPERTLNARKTIAAKQLALFEVA